MYRQGDLRAVILGTPQVRLDRRQRLCEVRRAGLAQQAAEIAAGNPQEHLRIARIQPEHGLLENAFIVQTGRAGQRRQRRQGMQLMLAEHAFQAFRLDRLQLPAGELGQALEVQQLVLAEQHQQGPHRIIQQDGLQAAHRRQHARAVGQLERYAQFAEQLFNEQRRTRGRVFCGFGHRPESCQVEMPAV